jgi:hypothetical protein
MDELNDMDDANTCPYCLYDLSYDIYVIIIYIIYIYHVYHLYLHLQSSVQLSCRPLGTKQRVQREHANVEVLEHVDHNLATVHQWKGSLGVTTKVCV